MTTYFEEPDGHGESTIWAVTGNRHAIPAIRQSDVTPGCWPDVVARMVSTTITNDTTPEDLDEAIAAHISGKEELTVDAVADLISRREDLTGDLHLDATAQRARDFARTPYDYPGEGDGYPPPGTIITTDDATVEAQQEDNVLHAAAITLLVEQQQVANRIAVAQVRAACGQTYDASNLLDKIQEEYGV